MEADVNREKNVEQLSVSCTVASLKLDTRKVDSKQMLYKELMKVVDEDEIRGIVFYPKDWARKCILTFKTKAIKNKVLIEGLTLFERSVEFNDEDSSIVKVKIEDSPNEMSNETLKRILMKYGTVIDVEKNMLIVDKLETKCYDGIRYAHISDMHTPIPPKISGQIKGQTVSLVVSYKNQPRENKTATQKTEQKCFRCGDSNHRIEKCTLTKKVCFSCQSEEHTQKDCPNNDGAKRDDNTVVFLSANCPLSNWNKENFLVDGKEFSCMEQYLTYSKAALFNDSYAQEEVMREPNQRIMKMIGTEVKNYNHADWLEEIDTILNTGLRAKFSAGKAKQYLIGTENRLIGEASENRRWGTGVHLNDPNALEHSKWTGSNFMGQTLMMIREEICDRDTSEKSENEMVNSMVNDKVKNGEENEGDEQKSSVNNNGAATVEERNEPKIHAAIVGDTNINLKLDDAQVPCEVNVRHKTDLKLCEIENCITESGIDPDQTAVLVLHAGSHEWNTSRTSETVPSGTDVFNQYKEIIDNISDRFTLTEIIVSSIPPRRAVRSNGQRNSEINDEIKELNDLLDSHCNQHGFLTFVNHSSKLSPENVVDSSWYHNSVELNKKGKTLVLQNICATIPHALSRWGYRGPGSDLF